MIENILAAQSKTKPLLPSQQRRFREVQLPDGRNIYMFLNTQYMGFWNNIPYLSLSLCACACVYYAHI